MIPKLENIERVRVFCPHGAQEICVGPVPIDFKERTTTGGEKYRMVNEGDGYQKVRLVPLEDLLNAMIEDNRQLRAELEALRGEISRQYSGEDF